MYSNLAILALSAFLFSTIAGHVERSVLTAPMVYICFGLIAGPVGFGVLDLHIDALELRVIAELTLAIVLFLDASKADLKVLRRHAVLPRRMLGLGLPLSIALGACVGTLVFPGMSLWEVCLLSTMLAATDAALGKAVVTNAAVPNRVRQSLNVESGLNDGLAVPILFVFLALAVGEANTSQGPVLALKLVLEEIGIGVAVAVIIGTVAVQLMQHAAASRWFTDVWAQLAVVLLALSCFAIAQSLGGSGFIASFVGGLLFGYFYGERNDELELAGESIGELMAMLTWVVFGAAFMGQFWGEMTWDVVVYSVLSLTVIRMLPVVISLLGTGEGLETKLFLAWFGPRGLASVVFLVIVSAKQLPSEPVLINTVICTITLCVVAHGVTANPWARRLARKES